MKKILVAEDSSEISKVLDLYLTSSGYEVTTCENGKLALDQARMYNFDLGIFDLMMPEMDGYTLISEIRKFSEMPIMILSAKNEDHDKILGLNIGADDYITKPFNPLELMARVNAALRRWDKMNEKSSHNAVLKVGELVLDTESFVLKKCDNEIVLTATEFKILKMLMTRPSQIFSKQQICENIYGEYFETDENAMTVHISHIREKIGENLKGNSYIKTVRGLGYKIENK